MNYSEIKFNDIANGLGIRTSLFVSGCRNRCPGCFNKKTWDFNSGKLFTNETCQLILDSMNEYTDGLSLLGGDPFEFENVEGLLPLVKEFKEKFPDKSIWCYTGYLYEDLIKDSKNKTFMSYIDILVDGRFELDLKNIKLKFKGSSNQRIIDVKKSLESSNVILHKIEELNKI